MIKSISKLVLFAVAFIPFFSFAQDTLFRQSGYKYFIDTSDSEIHCLLALYDKTNIDTVAKYFARESKITDISILNDTICYLSEDKIGNVFIINRIRQKNNGSTYYAMKGSIAIKLIQPAYKTSGDSLLVTIDSVKLMGYNKVSYRELLIFPFEGKREEYYVEAVIPFDTKKARELYLHQKRLKNALSKKKSYYENRFSIVLRKKIDNH